MVHLSKRLEALAGLVSTGARICDVGCDHGWLSIALVQSGRIPGAIAMDVNRGPLEAARAHVEACCLQERIDLRLSDGLAGLKPGEADSVVIAGMGGSLIMRILSEGEAVLESVRELVLGPQSEVPAVRRFLRLRGWTITQEEMILEDGKYYFLMRAVPDEGGLRGEKDLPAAEQCAVSGKEADPEKDELTLEDEFGPVLIRTRPETFLKWLERERKIAASILKQLGSAADSAENETRIAAVKERLTRMEALYYDR